jgi:hypothetical protein
LPIIAGVGTIGGLIQGSKANKTANQQLQLQQGQAQNQAQLFQQTAPLYERLLEAGSNLAGLSNRYSQIGAQLPYTNVTPGQLGIYSNPADALRLRAAEDEARQNLLGGLHNFSFGAGQRGLFGSSIDAAGRAALIGDALRGQNAFARQLAINAPGEAMNRLSTLAGLLNPGLGAGPTAAGLFGQGAQTALGQAQLAGGQAGSAISNYLQFQNLRNLFKTNQQQQPWQETSDINYLDMGGGK